MALGRTRIVERDAIGAGARRRNENAEPTGGVGSRIPRHVLVRTRGQMLDAIVVEAFEIALAHRGETFNGVYMEFTTAEYAPAGSLQTPSGSYCNHFIICLGRGGK